MKARTSGPASASVGEAFTELIDDSVELGVHLLGRRLLVDRADHGCHPWLGTLRYTRQQVGHEVGAASLPARACEHRSRNSSIRSMLSLTIVVLLTSGCSLSMIRMMRWSVCIQSSLTPLYGTLLTAAAIPGWSGYPHACKIEALGAAIGLGFAAIRAKIGPPGCREPGWCSFSIRR